MTAGDSTSSSNVDGYADAAPLYWSAGWRTILPMPRGKKFPPPTDYTGYKALTPSWPDVMAWSEEKPSGNAALHLPPGIIGIDVDAYDGKTGAQTLEIAQQRWGTLPRSVRSSSRDDMISGIWLYRVPDETRLATKIEFPAEGVGHIEIIQASHRYAIVWPSLHPAGPRYRWLDADGFVTEIPNPAELPRLPQRWIDSLAPGSNVDGVETVDIAQQIADLTMGELSTEVGVRLNAAISDLSGKGVSSRHDIACSHVLALLRLSEQGEPGVTPALLQLQSAFIETVTADGSRSAPQARSEFARMIYNERGHALIAATPTAVDVTEVDASEISAHLGTLHDLASEYASEAAVPPIVEREHAALTPEQPHSDDRDDQQELVEIDLSDDEAAFWASRASLRAIRDQAYARLASPWSVLAVCLCRALATIPPWVTLPPIIGGRGSLNFFAAIVGRSGAGKGISEAVAAELVLLPDEIPTLPAGSGEGLAHAYIRREGRDIKRERTAAVFSVPEVDALSSIAGRQGATIMSKLRSAYSGEEIGFSYADPTKRLLVGAHEYRLSMVVGVQPERAGALLDDSAGGTPQRFVWLPANDRAIGDEPGREVSALELPSPVDWSRYATTVAVPDEAAQIIRQAHIARSRGAGDALDGHSLQTREKVMVGLCALDGRTEPTLADWDLAGLVMDISDRTRREIDVERRAAAREAAIERGRERGIERDASESSAHQIKVERIANKLLRGLRRRGPVFNRRDVTLCLDSRDRKDQQAVADALDHLSTEGLALYDPEGGSLTLVEEKDQ